MKKLLFLIFTIFGILSVARSDQSCGVTDVFKCADGFTCCQGPTGRMCFNVQDGVCCEDLITCCDPKTSTCDNKAHKCVPIAKSTEALSFLSG